MNYGQLCAAVADYMNRQDIATQIPAFVQAVHVRLQETSGTLDPLVNPSDTNDLLAYDPNIYLYGAVAEAASYMRDTDLLTIYGAKFEDRVQKLRSKGSGVLRMCLHSPTP